MTLTLRPWQMEDAQLLAQAADHPDIARYMSDGFPQPYMLRDAQSFIMACLSADEQTQMIRAITMDNAPIGGIALYRGEDVYRLTGTLAYWLSPAYWGQGIMPRAIDRLCEDAFERYDLVRISAEPFEANLASCRALEKAGFRLEGILKNRVCKNGWIGNARLYALTR